MVRFIAGALIAGVWLGAGAARAAAPPIEDYGKLPAVEQMSLSPSGEKLAYLAVAGDGRQLVIRKAGGDILFTIRVGALRPRRVEWLGDGHVLIEASKTLDLDPIAFHSTQRVEATQSTIVDAATGAMKTVFFNDRLIYHATFGYYGYGRADGQEYGYFGGVTLGGGGESFIDFGQQGGSFEHGYADLYRVNLATGVSQKVGGGRGAGPVGLVGGRRRDGGGARRIRHQGGRLARLRRPQARRSDRARTRPHRRDRPVGTGPGARDGADPAPRRRRGLGENRIWPGRRQGPAVRRRADARGTL